MHLGLRPPPSLPPVPLDVMYSGEYDDGEIDELEEEWELRKIAEHQKLDGVDVVCFFHPPCLFRFFHILILFSDELRFFLYLPLSCNLYLNCPSLPPLSLPPPPLSLVTFFQFDIQWYFCLWEGYSDEEGSWHRSFHPSPPSPLLSLFSH